MQKKYTHLISFLVIMFFILSNKALYAQSCPENIGFEKGSFLNWKTFTGSVALSNDKNTISLSESAVTAGRHTILTSTTDRDVYGGFPVLSPNGSGHSVKLGNSETQKQAEGMAYLINVPNGANHFTITYQYALVFQAPNHTDEQQPRFDVKLMDVSTGNYIGCSSFKFIATSGLPGFRTSTVDATVIYKDWTPVTIDLSAYQGKQLRLEFTTADCTQGGHFGYAYVDVNEQCESAIMGNLSCEGAQSTKLKGPSGYQYYKWYNQDRSILYGEGENLEVRPALPGGTKILLDLVPYEGFGCANTVEALITTYNFELNLMSTLNVCDNQLVDLTSSQYIRNKSDQVSYTFYRDAALQQTVTDPQKISVSGTYYVKATSPEGCISVKNINITFHPLGSIEVLSSFASCGQAVDLTSNQIQKTVPANAAVSYFSDASLQLAVANPRSVTTSGDYYINYQFAYCNVVKKVSIAIYALPNLVIRNPLQGCLPNGVDLTQATVTAGSDAGLIFSYFTDASCTRLVANPTTITASGVYYVRAKNNNGCSRVAPINVTVYPALVLVANNPNPVCEPATIDLTDLNLYTGTSSNVVFKFTDASGNSLSDPKHISQSGTYFVTIQNSQSCAVTAPVQVKINQQPNLVINQPRKIFLGTSFNLTNTELLKGSTGYNSITYWKNAASTQALDHPEAISQPGRYYVSIANASGCSTSGAIDVAMVPKPKVDVPTAFTPLSNQNKLLYPFYQGIKQLYSFKVYNKWGILVFETKLMYNTAGWDGIYKNQLQPVDTYTWFVDAVNELEERFTKTGKTMLLK